MALDTMSNLFLDNLQPPVSESDIIWKTFASNLEQNNNEILLPTDIEQSLGEDGLNYLKLRLSIHLSGGGARAPVIGFHDDALGCYRIMRTPAFHGDGKISTSSIAKGPIKSYKLRSATKKTKVPRPPNAFILFRAHRHPELKAQFPTLHNNDISIIVGKEWREAPEVVKNQFRAQAEAHKAKHAAAYPGYQYSPRKPSEKKRRMTSRKAARLAESQAVQNESPEGLDDIDDNNIFDMSSLQGIIPNAIMPLHDGTLQFTLPAGSAEEFQNEMEEHMSSIVSPANLIPLRPTQSASSIIPANIHNDQSFFDSMVDWNQIAHDLKMIQDLNDPTIMKVSGDGNGNLMIGTAEDRALFDQEIARLAALS